MKTKNRMTPQWGIFGIVTLILGLTFGASAQKKEHSLLYSECWDNPELIRQLLIHPYEPLSLKNFIGCENFSLSENTNPDISDIKTLGIQHSFSGVDSRHRTLLEKLIDIFESTPDSRQLVANAIHIRDQVNPQLYQRALKYVVLNTSKGRKLEQNGNRNKREGVAALNEETKRRIQDVNYLLSYPMKFIDRRSLDFIGKNWIQYNDKVCVKVRDEEPKDPEDLLTYFRDDFGLNAHHDAWHAIYTRKINAPFPHISRRGELFYYAHRQLLARYNFERITNGLNKTLALYIEDGKKIQEGYFTWLNGSKTNAFPNRPRDTELDDFYVCENMLGTSEANCTDKKKLIKISDFKDWTGNISEAIEKNSILFRENGIEIEKHLPEEEFIDVLVNIIEATHSSPNRERYGDLHNLGHQAVAVAHNKNRTKVITDVQGVMTDLAAAVRDPTFYRWHTRLDELYSQHKDKLQPYTSMQLGFDGVKIKSVKVQTEHDDAAQNEFLTFFDTSKLNISDGARASDSGPILVCIKHLQQHQFIYNIEVESNRQVDGIVRIFMAPKNDENGKPLNFAQQRPLLIELDTFPYPLTNGTNVIKRHSFDSSVTTSTRKSVGQEPKKNRTLPETNREVPDECGWPDNLLIPKGTPEGLKTTLFVIINDWETDRVDNSTMQDIESITGVSICGFGQEQAYPFKRPMGFPFDRVRKENTITEFSSLPNMHVIDAKIRFTNDTTP